MKLYQIITDLDNRFPNTGHHHCLIFYVSICKLKESKLLKSRYSHALKGVPEVLKTTPLPKKIPSKNLPPSAFMSSNISHLNILCFWTIYSGNRYKKTSLRKGENILAKKTRVQWFHCLGLFF